LKLLDAMKCAAFNNLPLSVITPKYKAFDADALLQPHLSRVSLTLLPPEDKMLRRALGAMERYDTMEAERILASSLGLSPGHPNTCVLSGFLALASCNYEQAADLLQMARGLVTETGILIRKLCPTLRFLIRISRFQFFPAYPDYYGTTLALAVAQGKLGKYDGAVETLREMTSFFGWRDEMRIIAAEIALAQGNVEAAGQHLDAESRHSRDDLDVTLHILQALAAFEVGEYHEAAILLRSDIVYVREQNPYLTTVAKFIYSHALEEDGLPVLALRESVQMDLKTVLNPELRKYMRWREEKLKIVLERIKGDDLLKAGDFNWFVKGSRLTPEALEEVLPLDLEQLSRPSDSEDATIAGRMRRLDAIFRGAIARAEVKEDPVNEVPPPADFNPNVLHDWSVSHAGDEEMCYYDFRGMREVPEKKLLSEHQLDKLFELTAVIGMIILALWLMVRCF
jgi:tetratricopeptide (TPR) repeat protein